MGRHADACCSGSTERMTLLLSTPLLFEYGAVLTRPQHLTASGATVEDVAASSDWVRLDYLWRPLLRDADDEMVLETAVNRGAEILATFNLADLAPAAARFGIRVLRPAALVDLVEEP